MRTNRQWILRNRPKAALAEGDVELLETPVASEVPAGKVLLKTIYVHLAPTVRNWMNGRGEGDGDGDDLYPSMPIGEPVKGPVISQVIASAHPRYPVGSYWFNVSGWQQYALVDPETRDHPLARAADDTDLALSLSVLGPNGMAAYFGMLRVGQAKAGDTVVVSGAAGSTGSVAAQIGKILGCRVIGIAGGPDKCRWLTDELGLDAAIDYKAENVEARLGALAPEGVNVFFDNVGGDILSAVVENMAMRGRIALCGQIATYNAGGRSFAPLNVMRLVYCRVTMQGFIMSDWWNEIDAARGQLAQWITQGRIKHVEDIREGIETVPAVFGELFTGTNSGTLLVKVGEPEAG